MKEKVTPRLVELTYEAALKSFWRKEALRKFVRASHISESFISTWAVDESKREFLDRLFQKLQTNEKGKSAILEMAHALSEQTTFPDLQNWEDSTTKILEAKKAVEELKTYIKLMNAYVQDEQKREEAKTKAREERTKIQRSLTDKAKLQQRLESLCAFIGTQNGGYEFQEWFYELLDFCEIQNRRPFVSNGRQIDGSITLEGTTYLVELKFTGSQSDATDIDSLRSKVDDKADNTMGLIFSISGYSSVAKQQASGRKTTIILFDFQHLYLYFTGTISLSDIILRSRRHASQTGEAYLEVSKF